MPPWGRPPGAGSRRAQDTWYRDYRQRRGERSRLEEIHLGNNNDNDDDDNNDDDNSSYDSHSEEMALAPYTREEQRSYAGAQLSARRLGNRSIATPDDSMSVDDEMDLDERNSGGRMQLVLLDTDEELVRSARERIRRARLTGKSKIGLTRQEIDALERENRRVGYNQRPSYADNPAFRSTAASGAGAGVGARARAWMAADPQLGGAPGPGMVARHVAATQSMYDPASPPYVPGSPASASAFAVPDLDASAGPLPSNDLRSRRQRSPTPVTPPGSSHSSQPRTPPSPLYYHHLQTHHDPRQLSSTARLSLLPDVSRSRASSRASTSALDAPEWTTRTRSRSNAQLPSSGTPVTAAVGTGTPPLPYPVHPPASPYLQHAHRGASDPAVGLPHDPIRRRPPPSMATATTPTSAASASTTSQGYTSGIVGGGRAPAAAASDPALARRWPTVPQGPLKYTPDAAADESGDAGGSGSGSISSSTHSLHRRLYGQYHQQRQSRTTARNDDDADDQRGAALSDDERGADPQPDAPRSGSRGSSGRARTSTTSSGTGGGSGGGSAGGSGGRSGRSGRSGSGSGGGKADRNHRRKRT